MILTLVIVCFLFALVPAWLFRANLRAYVPLSCPQAGQQLPPVSVLIPARNEENAIGDAVRAALRSQGIELEVIVLDDHSDDRTAAIVEQLSTTDPRRPLGLDTRTAGRLVRQAARLLGACPRGAFILCCCLSTPTSDWPRWAWRMAAFVASEGADLASGIPHQETVTLLEKMLIPLIHFVLLSFLPIRRMRRSRKPAFAAGCGQLFIANATAYHCCGGHAVIRDTLHDGLKLPRVFRAAGLKTDLFDATDLATCRMYRSAREVWFGLAKNAGEALAAPAMIGPMTAILLGGQVARNPALAGTLLLALSLAAMATAPGSGRHTCGDLPATGRGGALFVSLCWERSSIPRRFSFCWPSSGSPFSVPRPAPLHLEGTPLSRPGNSK